MSLSLLLLLYVSLLRRYGAERLTALESAQVEQQALQAKQAGGFHTPTRVQQSVSQSVSPPHTHQGFIDQQGSSSQSVSQSPTTAHTPPLLAGAAAEDDARAAGR